MPVAVNVIGEPVRPVPAACRVFAPEVTPRVHDVSVATPAESVSTEDVGARDPPPAVMVKVIAVPGTGLPAESVTLTDGGVLTDDPAMAD